MSYVIWVGFLKKMKGSNFLFHPSHHWPAKRKTLSINTGLAGLKVIRERTGWEIFNIEIYFGLGYDIYNPSHIPLM